MIHVGDCLSVLPTLAEKSVHTVVTSPPYFGLRDYGVDGQIGLEPTPDAFVAAMVRVFSEVRRVLRDDGTVWLNLGDSFFSSPAGNKTPSGFSQNRPKRMSTGLESYNAAKKDCPGLKPKDLIGIPWRVAFALQADGWYLRSDIIWHKPNPMPESVRDRPTKSHEYLFLLSKSPRYYFDAEAVREPVKAVTLERDKYTRITKGKDGPYAVAHDHETPSNPAGRNIRSVWTLPTKSFRGAHFAVMPPKLVEPCIKAGCPVGGTVLDPFAGAGTVGLVAKQLGRSFVGIELNAEYAAMAGARIAQGQPQQESTPRIRKST